MRSIVADGAAWSVCLSVCLSVTVVSHAKTSEAIEMTLGLWSRVGLRKHVLDGLHIVATWRTRLCGGDAAFLSSYFDYSSSSGWTTFLEYN